MKHIWNLFVKAGSDWVAWVMGVHEYLLRKRDFRAINIPLEATWGWRKLLRLRNLAS